MASAVEMVELLMWNNSNIKHIAEFHNARHEKVHGILRERERLTSCNERIQDLKTKLREGDVLAAMQRSPSTSIRRNYRTGVAQT
jgi:fructose-1,6-bisphosphatase/sedoheptulose 1,7-bisphosphatase-like protein